MTTDAKGPDDAGIPAPHTPTPPHSHTPHTCDYCGLPMGKGGYEPQPGRFYCCYGCYLVQGILGEGDEEGAAAGLIARLGVGSFLSMTVMMASLVFYTDAPSTMSPQVIRAMTWAMLLFSTPVFLVMGPPFLRGAGHGLRHGRLNTDALILVGAFSAYAVSALHVVRGEGHVYFDTATMLLVLVTVGKLLEASAKSNASKVVRGLLALGSRVARRLNDAGEEEETTPERLRVGDRVVVRPGEQIPMDGILLSGTGSVQEAAFTGESVPRVCAPGDRVYGGSLNTDGLLVVEATGIGESALLGQMARLVREAQARRAPVERMADRLAAFLVPAVWATAAGAAGYWWLHGDPEKGALAALSVMVVACPCALGLATPLAVSIAIARAARAGVLIRSGAALELLPRLDRVFLDKTGTLTRGTMSLQGVDLLDDAETEESVLAWIASLESASEHPVGRALVDEAKRLGLGLGAVSGFRAYPGRGVEGTVTLGGEQRTLMAGTAAFLQESGIAVAPPCHPQSTPAPPDSSDPSDPSDPSAPPHTRDDHSLVYLAWGGRARAAFHLSDRPRDDAAAVVSALRDLGVRVTILSGDREERARRLAEEVGVTEACGACSPAEKVAAIEAARNRGERVAMVGDGVNDAPALAAADVGIALAGGTDLAREAGDVVLHGDELGRIPWSIHLARRTYRVIAWNLVWAFGYNAIALVAAFQGRLHPLLAAILMLFSSFFVLGNSLRLVRDEGP